jgi:hypothetical protein
MSENEGDSGQGFVVKDRRRFSETGETRSEASDEPKTPPQQAPSAGATADEARTEAKAKEAPTEAAADAASESRAEHESHAIPPITFATFVLSLSTQALAHLGEIPDPTDGSTRVELSAAQEIIDILAMLQQKTRGNLAQDEDRQLEGALYVLRMKYVECL